MILGRYLIIVPQIHIPRPPKYPNNGFYTQMKWKQAILLGALEVQVVIAKTMEYVGFPY